MREKEKIAVLIPCYNEALTIEKVVKDFKQELPKADIYVYDNNSTDGSGELAEKVGAIVVPCPEQGKGNTIRAMFNDIDATIYVMVDGDDTYPADEVKKLIQPIRSGVDMVVGDRLSSTYYQENKKFFNGVGNWLVKFLVNLFYGKNLSDIMSGYRTFSKNFVKNIDLKSTHFEVETEMTINAINKGFAIESIPIQYRDRPEGSFSKLDTYKDGFKVLWTIAKMVIHDRLSLLANTAAAIVAIIELFVVIKAKAFTPTAILLVYLVICLLVIGYIARKGEMKK